MIRPSSAAPAPIQLPAALATAMQAHARAELPNEACGLVGGNPATGVPRTFHPARNRRASPLRYDVHPEDLVRIVLDIESAGQALVAVFHSHPRSPAVPSATDVRDARYDVVHLIASLSDPEAEPREAIRAWRVGGGTAIEVPIRISE